MYFVSVHFVNFLLNYFWFDFDLLFVAVGRNGKYVHSDKVITTTTTKTVLWPFVRDYPGEPVPEETFTQLTYPDHQPFFISFFHLLQFIASSLFN